MLHIRRRIARAAVTLGILLALSPAAQAGPPLICHPFDAGSAPLLPWGKGPGWNTPDRSYDVRRLADDTLRLLGPDTPVLARMENLRRATVYATEDRPAAAELLAAVLGRVLAAAADGSRDPFAWFDAGYLVESYRQAALIHQRDVLTGAERPWSRYRSQPGPIDGYRMVRKAIALAGSSPEMEFAASLMKEGPAAAEHRARAAAGAASGSLLARNLAR